MGSPIGIGIVLLLSTLVSRCFCGTVSVVERQPILYDTVTPKLRIQGTGFQSGSAVSLDIVPPLKQDQDYNLEVTSDTVLTLILKKHKKWAAISQDSPQVTLYLSAVKIDGVNQLDGTVSVAAVIGTPTVTESSQVIYHQSTPTLTINGTSLSKVHAIVFDPPIKVDVDYSIVQHTYGAIKLTLLTGKAWRQEPGPLKLVRIDCGGGLLQLGSEGKGIRVAEVQADLDAHGVTVVTSKEPIYQSTPSLMITGTGFNSEITKLRFYNNLRGQGQNYTTTMLTPTSMTLQLNEGAKWRENVKQLPGPLTILAADAGAGWVALGATAAKRGRTVATVYEDPKITPADVELWQTHSHHLTITGAGFNYGFRPQITTTPPLTYADDYTITVLNRTCMVMELALDSQWCLPPCEISINSINTGAGVVDVGSVKVAHVVEDSEIHESGISVARSVDLLYQSAHYKPLDITGTGFTNDIKLTFYPPLVEGTDYTMSVTSGEELTLNLIEGRKWREDHGPLLLFAVDPDGDKKKEQPIIMGSGAGIQVANILKDPVVESSEKTIYESHTTMVTIKGSGFTGGFGVGEFPIALQLQPTGADAFEVVSNTDTLITLRLKDGKKWANVDDGATKILKVKAIDSGAGEEQFKPPVTIADIYSDLSDDEKAQCDDSCIYANDGECDEEGRDTYYGSWYSDYSDDFWTLGGYSSYYRSSYTTDEGYYGYSYAGYGSFGLSTLNNIAPCSPGTDCTDCGGIAVGGNEPECENTCMFARDGYCDDPRANNLCKLGTDCQDCGPKSAANFTDHWDTAWFDEDDDFFYDYDEDLTWWNEFEEQPEEKKEAGGASPVDNIKKETKTIKDETAGAGSTFMSVLEGLVYLIGAVFVGAGALFAYRWYNGQPIPYMLVSQNADRDVEMRGRFRGPITPDVVHTGGDRTD
mmetsp:Transcript_30114/g.37774  ORF Transcript_30114/g.37774 Transcript_30114/m.37774 type:complete len:926 (-) Transcript_30114:391-3168(-)